MTKIGITDVANGINEVRDMTPTELAEYNSLVNNVETEKALAKAQKDEAEAALISSLGLTREQVISLGLIRADYVKPSYE